MQGSGSWNGKGSPFGGGQAQGGPAGKGGYGKSSRGKASPSQPSPAPWLEPAPAWQGWSGACGAYDEWSGNASQRSNSDGKKKKGWRCGTCNFFPVYNSKTECPRCAAPRPESAPTPEAEGDTAAGGSPPWRAAPSGQRQNQKGNKQPQAVTAESSPQARLKVAEDSLKMLLQTMAPESAAVVELRKSIDALKLETQADVPLAELLTIAQKKLTYLEGKKAGLAKNLAELEQKAMKAKVELDINATAIKEVTEELEVLKEKLRQEALAAGGGVGADANAAPAAAAKVGTHLKEANELLCGLQQAIDAGQGPQWMAMMKTALTAAESAAPPATAPPTLVPGQTRLNFGGGSPVLASPSTQQTHPSQGHPQPAQSADTRVRQGLLPQPQAAGAGAGAGADAAAEGKVLASGTTTDDVKM